MDASEIEDAGYAEHARMDDSLGSTSTDEQLPWDSPDPAADAAQPESEAQQRREEGHSATQTSYRSYVIIISLRGSRAVCAAVAPPGSDRVNVAVGASLGSRRKARRVVPFNRLSAVMGE